MPNNATTAKVINFILALPVPASPVLSQTNSAKTLQD